MDGKKIPHYQRIARQLKQAIERGELAPGSRLPASRVYAQELGVSRATIENAWGDLVAQGWLERRGQAGTFVSDRLLPQQNAPVQPITGDEPTQSGAGGSAPDLEPACNVTATRQRLVFYRERVGWQHGNKVSRIHVDETTGSTPGE